MRIRNINRCVAMLGADFTRRTLMMIWIAGIGITGCLEAPAGELSTESTRAGEAATLAAPGQSATQTPALMDPGAVQLGVSDQWPEFIPADIPVLEGEIRTVLAASSHVRIFYHNVSKEQVLDYLELLESSGFNLEYRVYVQEGFPDNSEEKIEQGQFDAVDIIKGDYHMNITYGADPTYDIYLSGFQQETIALPWPAELPASVPPVKNCPLQSFNPGGGDVYHLTCQKEHDGVEQDYLAQLLASGFEEKRGTKVHNLVIETTVYENDEVVIQPNIGFSPTFFSMQVYIKTEPEALSWPAELVGVAPEPERCVVELGPTRKP